MSKADKMFRDRQYEKTESENYVGYKLNKQYITFWKRNCDYGGSYVTGDGYNNLNVDKGLHLAIHEKMKELGWLDV